MPKFSGVGTMPTPKTCCQMRLTMTRAVRPAARDFGAVSHRASARLRPLVPGQGGSAASIGEESVSQRTRRMPG